MSILALAPLLIAAVPPVTVGPDDAARAPVIAAPIARVTVFEDRARVLRRATVDVPAGASTWRLPDLPGQADVGAVRATVTGAGRLLRLEANPATRERLPLAPAAQLLDRLDAAQDGLERLADERRVLLLRLQVLAALAPAPSVPEAQREGRPAPGLFAEAWARTASALAAERQRLAERVAALDVEWRAAVQARNTIALELDALAPSGDPERVVEVLAVIEAAGAGKATVELEYFVSGARWRPAYELRFLADEGRADLAAYGLVTQSTGEDWSDVELHLSTALPSLGIALPSLMTWTLGEAKEWRPQVRPRATPPTAPLYAAPQALPTRSETAEVVERSLVMARLSSREASGQRQYDFADETIAGGLVRPEGSAGAAAKRTTGSAPGWSAPPGSAPPPPAPPPPPPPRMAPVVQAERSKSEAADYEVMAIATSADSAASTSDVAYRSLALFDAPPPRPWIPPPDSPAAQAGGLDHVYVSATRATVPAGGEAYRAPLGRETHPVTAFYEATPALAPQAYLRATVTNRSPRPILGGPVGIFLGSAYAGDGALATTGAGGALALPLGGDEDVRVSRKMILATETTGVFSKDDVTTYRVVLEVASFKKKAVRVVVREPLPVSGHEDVKVKLLSTTPAAPKPDEDGVVTWSVEVQPGKVAKLELAYQIVRPADFQLYQR